jgi:hypothetical protein
LPHGGAPEPLEQPIHLQLEIGDQLHLHSKTQDWLIVSGAKAQYQGTGFLEGRTDEVIFQVTVIDGQLTGGGGTDKIRVQIWLTSTGALIYDNQPGAPNGADPTTPIGGGKTVIKK